MATKDPTAKMRSLCQLMIDGRRDKNICTAMVKEINKLFPEAECLELIITNNPTEFMFGARCYIEFSVDPEILYNILFTDSKIGFCHYSIDLDSKVFDPMFEINDRELMAIILHEIGHVFNKNTAIDEVRAFVDQYMAKNKAVLSVKDVEEYHELIAMAISEYLIHDKSIFNAYNTEYTADDYAVRYGYGEDLKRNLDKLFKMDGKISAKYAKYRKFDMLVWTLSSIVTSNVRKSDILKAMKSRKAEVVSKSTLRDIDRIIASIDKKKTVSEAGIRDSILDRINKSKKQTMKNLEEDYYELYIRTKNLETEDDAVYILRKISIRISMLDEYLNTIELTDDERTRWTKLFTKYLDLREELTKANISKSKQYGIYVNYPEIVPNRY